MQQAVDQVCARDFNVVGQIKAALESAFGDPVVQILSLFTLLALILDVSGNRQLIVLHLNVEFGVSETGDSHRDAIGIFVGLFDVVGWVGWYRVGGDAVQ